MVNIDYGNGLVPEGTKPLFNPILGFHSHDGPKYI